MTSSFFGTARADTLIKLHKPNTQEIKLFDVILAQIHSSEYNGDDDDTRFTIKDIEVAFAHLDQAVDPEIVLRINTMDYDGAGIEGFSILKKVAGKWIEITNDYFRGKHAIIVTDRVVNGFKVLRVPADPYDRIYQGNGYTCPKCPP